jgi:DNA anti-recombination protein RmuC
VVENHPERLERLSDRAPLVVLGESGHELRDLSRRQLVDELARTLADAESSWWTLDADERERFRELAQAALYDVSAERRRLADERRRLRWKIEQSIERLEKDVRSLTRLLGDLAQLDEEVQP